MADKGLDRWVGRRVTVQLAEEESHRFGCTLESADDRGIVVSYQRREDPGTHHRFYPWHNIRYVHLPDATQSVG